MSFTETLGRLSSGRPAVATGRELPARAQFLFAAAVFLACLVPALVNGCPLVWLAPLLAGLLALRAASPEGADGSGPRPV